MDESSYIVALLKWRFNRDLERIAQKPELAGALSGVNAEVFQAAVDVAEPMFDRLEEVANGSSDE